MMNFVGGKRNGAHQLNTKKRVPKLTIGEITWRDTNRLGRSSGWVRTWQRARFSENRNFHLSPLHLMGVARGGAGLPCYRW